MILKTYARVFTDAGTVLEQHQKVEVRNVGLK
jgi:hypothetical protein